MKSVRGLPQLSRWSSSLLIIVAWSTLAVVAQENPYPFRAADLNASPRIARLRSDIQRVGAVAVEQFWNEVRRNSAPLIEPIPGDPRHSLLTFVWRGSSEARNVIVVDGVALGVGGVDPANSQMTRIANTDVWYRTYDVRNDARFTYALSENDPLTLFTDPNRKSNSKPDPLNPHVFLTNQTYVELKDAPAQPWIVPVPQEMAGNVQSTAIEGLGAWVYTPHDFQSTGTYPLVVVMGGRAFMNYMSIPAILDNLIAQKRIPPAVAVVMAGNADDLMCSASYADFLANSVVPWMRRSYRATSDPKRTVIAGSSLGGLTATCSATKHPEVFGNVLSQSGSYWWKPASDDQPEWLTKQIASKPTLPIRFFLEVGRMEAAEDQLFSNRRLRDALSAKGYIVRYSEFNGNHTYLAWRGTFGEGLIELLGR